ncbi:MAG: MotA/TolQ/ExbB proton channel family protein [Xanthomonadales bacterium]|nr:MotA/TolQ/ExbB proton channel family protein [Xanthomonadales bacterium]
MERSILQEFLFYMESGGWVMPPLVVLLFVLWFAIGYRFAALRRGSKRGARPLIERFQRGKAPKKDGVMVRAVRKGVALKAEGVPDLRRWLDDAFAEEEREVRRYNTLITTIVLVAPLVGLLGTVVGMIETFDSLGDMSLFSQSGGIAGGISQALFTTQMGLAVAIPGLVVNGILTRRQKDIELELAQVKDSLCTDTPRAAGS